MRKLIAALLLSVGSLATPAGAQTQVMMGYAQPHDPDTDPAAAAAQEFRAQLRHLTGGRLTVELFPEGVLGGNRQMTALTEKGVIQTALVTIGGVTPVYPPLMVTQLPFAFDTTAAARQTFNGAFGRAMAADLEARTPLALMGFVDPGGFHVLTNLDRDIGTPDDLWGLRLRAIPGFKPLEAMITAVDAVPVPVSSRDELPMLATGGIDGQMSPSPVILARGFDNVQHYATLLDHLYSPYVWVFNRAFLDNLPEADANAVREAVRLSIAKAEEVVDRINQSEKGLSGLAKRMKVRHLTPPQRDAFRRIMQPPVEAAIRETLAANDAAWMDRFKAAASTR